MATCSSPTSTQSAFSGSIPARAPRPSYLSSDGFLAQPRGIALEADGDVLVTDNRALGVGAVIRIDPMSGAQTVVSAGDHFRFPGNLRVRADGKIIVVDGHAFGGGGGLIEVDPVSGSQTPLAAGGFFFDPTDLVIDANGDYLVVDPGSQAVIKVDRITATQTIISSGGDFSSPQGITLDAFAQILVADYEAFGGPGAVFRVDPVTGAQTVVSAGMNFESPIGITVVMGPFRDTTPPALTCSPLSAPRDVPRLEHRESFASPDRSAPRSSMRIGGALSIAISSRAMSSSISKAMRFSPTSGWRWR